MPIVGLILLVLLVAVGTVIVVAIYYLVIAAVIIVGVIIVVSIIAAIVQALFKAFVGNRTGNLSGGAISAAQNPPTKKLGSVGQTQVSNLSSKRFTPPPSFVPQIKSYSTKPLSSATPSTSHNRSSYDTRALTSGSQSSPSGSSSHTFHPGALISQSRLNQGRFEIIEVLGQGGFGITYLALDHRASRKVAIKEFFLQNSCSRNDDNTVVTAASSNSAFNSAKKKFLDEYSILSRLSSDGVVQIFDCFEENGTAYLVMEFLKGPTLDEAVNEHGGVNEQRALEIITTLANAVKLVHDEGLLHRDIQPSNVIVCENGKTKLIDFGLSKKIENNVGFSTRRLSNTVSFGTPGFAPLEQYSVNGMLGPQTDIYAIGAILYFLLTAEVPTAATERAVNDELLPPHHKNPNVTAKTSEAVMNSLSIHPNQRPQSVSDFLLSLESQVQNRVLPQQTSNGPNQGTVSVTPNALGIASAVRDDSVRRVKLHFNKLVHRYPEHSSKLLKSRDWQVGKCEEQTNFWIGKGLSYTEALQKWEEGACKAADAKIH